MDLLTLCGRRTAIIAALAGGFVIAVLAAGMCARGVVWGGGVCATALRSGLANFLS